MRFKLTLEYDGGPFLGWQRVVDGASVQGALEQAVFKLTSAHADVIGAGRTDAGVHARGQVAHVDIAKPLAPQRLADALNAHLRPLPVAVLHAEEAAPDFHARFDAVRRVYLYRIINRRAPLALEYGKAWRVPRDLDVYAMNAAAQRLVGHHDFTTFRDSKCQAASPLKTLDRCEVSATPSPTRSRSDRDTLCSGPPSGPAGEGARGGVMHGASESTHALRERNGPTSAIQNDAPREAYAATSQHTVSPHPLPIGGPYVEIACESRSFLHRQVRSIVGTLVEVGLGKMSADDVTAALAAKDRSRCGPVAPPDGLYLMRVDY